LRHDERDDKRRDLRMAAHGVGSDRHGVVRDAVGIAAEGPLQAYRPVAGDCVVLEFSGVADQFDRAAVAGVL